MADTATLNVRMDSNTKEKFVAFCEEVGISASALMNIFAKTVVRDQEVPFPLTAKHLKTRQQAYARLFPTDTTELDAMLSTAESVPMEQCVPATEGFEAFERQMGW